MSYEQTFYLCEISSWRLSFSKTQIFIETTIKQNRFINKFKTGKECYVKSKKDSLNYIKLRQKRWGGVSISMILQFIYAFKTPRGLVKQALWGPP